MRRTLSGRALVASDRRCDWLLRAYPTQFRGDYGTEMRQVFRECCREAYDHQGLLGLLRVWLATFRDLAVTATEERMKGSPMHSLSPVDFRRHIAILGWLYFLGHALFLLVLWRGLVTHT